MFYNIVTIQLYKMFKEKNIACMKSATHSQANKGFIVNKYVYRVMYSTLVKGIY